MDRLDRGCDPGGTVTRRDPDSSHPSALIFRLLSPVIGLYARDGQLEINFRDIASTNFGNGSGPPHRVRIESLRTILRILCNPELGCGETYMDGGWRLERGGLESLLTMFARNERPLRQTLPSRAVRALSRIIRRTAANDPGQSRENAAHHYDIGNDLYEAFLDEGMNYSCAFFEDPGQSLRKAQLNKLRTTIRRLDIGPGMHVLDIGSGWGELTRIIARETEAAHTVGITLARNQLALARERAGTLPGNRVDYQLTDYRDHAEGNPGAYDRIVSVGMFEHVGQRNLVGYFAAIRRMLAADGCALVHTILRQVREDTSPWMKKYIFHGGYIPTLRETIAAARKVGLELAHGPFIHESFNYAQTLRLWHERFNEAWPRLDKTRYDERFRRMWNYYLIGSKTAFDINGLYVGQLLLKKGLDRVS